MARNPNDPNPDPTGGRAAERLRQFEKERGISPSEYPGFEERAEETEEEEADKARDQVKRRPSDSG